MISRIFWSSQEGKLGGWIPAYLYSLIHCVLHPYRQGCLYVTTLTSARWIERDGASWIMHCLCLCLCHGRPPSSYMLGEVSASHSEHVLWHQHLSIQLTCLIRTTLFASISCLFIFSVTHTREFSSRGLSSSSMKWYRASKNAASLPFRSCNMAIVTTYDTTHAQVTSQPEI